MTTQNTQTIATPDMGVEQAQVIEITVQVGDTVTAEETIMLVESDKASVEIPASVAGSITEILVKQGDNIQKGTPLVTLSTDTSAADSQTADKQAADTVSTDNTNASSTHAESSKAENTPASTVNNASPSQPAASEQTFALPDLGVEKAEVLEVLAKVGDMVTEQDNIVLLESEKASMEVPSPATGELVSILVKQGDSVSAGANFVVIKTASHAPAMAEEKPANAQSAGGNQTSVQTSMQTNAQAAENAPATSPAASKNPNKAVYAGPAVRKLCRELGVDISQVTGSAVNGRIIKEDVHQFVKTQMNSKPTAASTVTSTALPPLPDMSSSEWGATHEEPLTNLQKVSIPQLTYNTLIPQVTQFDLADITDTENYRQSVKAALKKDGVSLTVVAFIIKAVAYALKKYPKFNSHLSDDHSKLIMRDEVHIGMAVATDSGLIVPVLRHADQKGLVQIATELGEIAKKAREKKIGMKDLTGAGFSISSQGNMGGTYFTPLVNVPQVAILGVSEATMQPRWNAQTQSFEPRLMLPLSLSYDHRVINGADAAIFTRYLANLLADVRGALM